MYPNIIKKLVIDNLFTNKFLINDIVQIFKISRRTIYYWINKYKNNILYVSKSVENQIKIFPEVKLYIKKYTLRNMFMNINKLINNIKKKYKISISKTSIYNILKQFKITNKRTKLKTIHINKKTHSREVKELLKNIKKYKNTSIISIDEIHFNTNLYPLRGWNKSNKKVVLNRNSNLPKKRYSVICAISIEKIEYIEIHNKPINSNIFESFLKKLFEKCNKPNLLMDNVSFHKTRKIKDLTLANDKNIIFNVPYNPDTNPIENVFSIAKNYVRSCLDNHINLITNITDSFTKIKQTDLINIYNKAFKNKISKLVNIQ
jgi:transposase